MRLSWVVKPCFITVLAAFLTAPLGAQSPGGQADLDRAVDHKLFAGSQGDLDQVIVLCESALAKGLDRDNELLAKRVLAGTLYHYGEVLSRPVLEDHSLDQRAKFLAAQALPKLRQSVEIDDKQFHAYYLIARLESLPGGDRERANIAAEKAAELAERNDEIARVQVLQGELAADDQQKLAKYNEALDVQPDCSEALQRRGTFYLAQGELEKAIADFEVLQQNDASNLDAYHGLIQALTDLKRYDAAQQQLEKAWAIAPNDSLNFILHARLLALQDKASAAIDVLGQALRAHPDDATALLVRAQLRLSTGSPEAARNDLNRVLVHQLSPVQAMLSTMSSKVAAKEKQDSRDSGPALQNAMRDLENDADAQIRLASDYAADKRPWKAIVIFTQILREDPENVDALRGRAEMRLRIGQPEAAIDDYEEALRIEPNNSAVMNHLAWALATSTVADVRNARRSISLARRACQLTQFQRADMLSTLAAAYAEAGDFDNAVRWAQQALELDDLDQETTERLREELDSYEDETPWREPPRETNSESVGLLPNRDLK